MRQLPSAGVLVLESLLPEIASFRSDAVLVEMLLLSTSRKACRCESFQVWSR